MATLIISIVVFGAIYGTIAYLADKQERETAEHNERIAWRK